MNRREKTLAVLLLVVLVAGLAWLGFFQLSKWKKDLDARQWDLEKANVEAQDLLAQDALWQARSGWLEKSQPALANRKESEVGLVNAIQESAKKHDVALNRVQPADPVERPDLFALVAVVDAKADLEKVLAWLHDLQEPGEFISIPALKMLPDPEDTAKVNLSFNLQKWFRKAPANPS